MLTLKQMTDFVTIVRSGSLSKAALSLSVSQSALTQQLKHAEGRIGLPLLQRTGRGVVPTAAGEALLESASAIGQELERLHDRIAGLRAEPSGAVTLAVTPMVAKIMTAPVAMAARARCPKVVLRFVETGGTGVVDWLAEGKADLAVSFIPLTQVGHLIDGETLIQDRMSLVGTPAALRRLGGPEAGLAELKALPLVLPSVQNGFRRWLDLFCRERGIVIDPVLEIDSASVTLDLVAQEKGFTILPCAVARAELASRALGMALLTDPVIPAWLTLFVGRGRELSPAKRAVIRLIKDQAALLSRPIAEAFEPPPAAPERADAELEPASY